MRGTIAAGRGGWLLAALLLAGCGRPAGGPDREAAAPMPAPAAVDGAAAEAPAAPAAPAAAGTASAPAALFDDARLGLRVEAVPGWQPRAGFRRDYLAGEAWKADAGPDSRGTPLFALVLDGSDEVAAAELRIGSSDTAPAVAGCERVPDYAEPAGGETVVLDGVPFRRFRFADAAMSHYLEVEAYRAVRGEQCLAIDLLLAGTRPEVYDPPRQPPFDAATAKAQLRQALAAIRLRPPSP